MALRRQNISPAANLLRNSRLFSLPNPLPRPEVSTNERRNAVTPKSSGTATLPYPTHQAIATTKSSLARGDWGLKRPIPARSRIVQTSNPVLRVTQLDSIEHVTDYDSAADHVRTREKFEELDIPMMRGMQSMRETGVNEIIPDGAFEYRSDITSYDNEDGLDDDAVMLENIKEAAKINMKEQKLARAAKKKNPDAPGAPFTPHVLPPNDIDRHNIRRWKYEGPWIPGMSSEEFTNYVTKQLESRKEEFHGILVQYVKTHIYTSRMNEWRNTEAPALDEAEAEQELREKEKQWSQITSEEIDAEIKKLRQDAAHDPLRSRLFRRLIAPFLRLPSFKYKDDTWSANNRRHGVSYMFEDSSIPLSTHPSAGLGYLRSTSYIMNHPLLGPQERNQPVTARVMQPRTLVGFTERHARFGVGGFVTNDPQSWVNKPRHLNEVGPDIFDYKTVGGAKVEVLPQYASVSVDGRIHLKVDRATSASTLIKRGELLDSQPTNRRNNANNLIHSLSSAAKAGLAAAGRAGQNAKTLGADDLKSMSNWLEEGRNHHGSNDNADARSQSNLIRRV